MGRERITDRRSPAGKGRGNVSKVKANDNGKD